MIPFAGISSLVDLVRAWPVDSQQGSRRNAMVACTELAQRRAEREDVEDFFALLEAPAEPLVRAST